MQNKMKDGVTNISSPTLQYILQYIQTDPKEVWPRTLQTFKKMQSYNNETQIKLKVNKS